MKIAFFGSGSFPLSTFQKLRTSKLVASLALVTVPQASFKEKNLIKTYAAQNHLEVLQPDLHNPEHVSRVLPQVKPYSDLGIVCNYGYMIPDSIIEQFAAGMVVIHPSLLPKYRGAAPIQRALMKGEQETGLSFIRISKNKFDAGDILLQKTIQIEPADRYLELSNKLSALSADSVEHLLKNHDTLQAVPQDSAQETKAPKLKPEKIVVNFDEDAHKWYNVYRGVYGTNFHSLKLQFGGKTLYIEKASLATVEEVSLLVNQLEPNQGSVEASPGAIYLLGQRKFKNFIYIQFKTGWLRLEKFRYADRGNVQEAYTFKDQHLQGYRNGSISFKAE